MSAAGSVTLDAQWWNGVIHRVSVRSSRPSISKILVGRPPQVALEIIKRLYTVCVHAHAAASANALAAATGSADSVRMDPGAATEAIAELMLGTFTKDAGAALGAAHAARADRRILRRLLEESQLGTSLEAWLAMSTYDDWQRWIAETRTPLADEARRRWIEPDVAEVVPRLLPLMSAADSIACWPRLDAQHALRPLWGGQAARTGPLARHRHRTLVQALGRRPLLQSWVARLVDLVNYAQGLPGQVLGEVSTVGNGPGTGRSVVETARGMLVHEVTVTNGAIASYVIVAPTEWNFHPDGNAVSWLSHTRCETVDGVRQLASGVVEALDPCVECDVRVHEAQP